MNQVLVCGYYLDFFVSAGIPKMLDPGRNSSIYLSINSGHLTKSTHFKVRKCPIWRSGTKQGFKSPVFRKRKSPYFMFFTSIATEFMLR